MKKSVVRGVLWLVVLWPALASAQTLPSEPLIIDTAGGARHFTAELALTSDQQERGLMFRNSLAPDAGMLFVFPQDQIANFWMKNTLIPLDMVFILSDGHVAEVKARATPLSEDIIASHQAVRAVLEIGGGVAAKLGIEAGDLVHAATFGNAPN